MKLSVNVGVVGKIPKEELRRHGDGWDNIDVSFEEAFGLITNDGLATSAELSSTHRTGDNFVSRELIMVDIDAGMTLQELFANAFYDEFGGGFYVTPSHTDEKHRFRILFRLESPITDPKKLRNLNRGLLRVFGEADQACKDPVRLFYGTPNCILKELRLDKVLDDSMVNQLLNMVELYDREGMTQADYTYEGPQGEMSDERRKQILDLLQKTFIGEYHQWRNVGWGLKQGGFSLGDFQYVTRGMMNSKTPGDAKKIWDGYKADGTGEVTMGSVIYLLKLHHGDDCLVKTQISKEEWKLQQLMHEVSSKYNLLSKGTK